METDQASPAIADLVDTARRLRTVRAACRQFFTLWALQQARQTSSADPVADALADPANHDWSLLYRGSILDD